MLTTETFITRTIPTRVGKTRSPNFKSSISTDHPHTRGENRSFCSQPNSRIGPSPHAWGKRDVQQRLRHAVRTIPTRVGKTRRRRPGSAFRSDHPHTRGENALRLCFMTGTSGPSPHAWGKLIAGPV